MQRRSAIAVLDMGKTNVKLSVVTAEGAVLETLVATNSVLPGPPWRHNDLAGMSGWVFESLALLCRRHPIGHVIATAYGSGGMLVTGDPDGADAGLMLPMIDYEQALPAGVAEAYAPHAGSFFDRGSAVMQGATHQARQLYWMQRDYPDRVAAARCYLGTPQYWAWRMSGVAVSETSFLGAQSHLWNGVEKRFSPVVMAMGWHRLLPPLAPAWQDLGPLRPALAARFGLPENLRVHTGAHDSSTNFYRYQAAGLSDFAVVSTGTWIVALADDVALESLDETRNMTLNSDVFGAPAGGALVMGGREFTLVAGEQAKDAVSDAAVIGALMARGTFALPAFGADSGQFPRSAGCGRIAGLPPQNTAERLALAVLYMALLTVQCAEMLGRDRRIVLDGSYLRDPNYVPLVAALRGGAETLFNPDSYGIAAGAALLCSHGGRESAPLHLKHPHATFDPAAAVAYFRSWLTLAQDNLQRT